MKVAAPARRGTDDRFLSSVSFVVGRTSRSAAGLLAGLPVFFENVSFQRPIRLSGVRPIANRLGRVTTLGQAGWRVIS